MNYTFLSATSEFRDYFCLALQSLFQDLWKCHLPLSRTSSYLSAVSLFHQAVAVVKEEEEAKSKEKDQVAGTSPMEIFEYSDVALRWNL